MNNLQAIKTSETLFAVLLNVYSLATFISDSVLGQRTAAASPSPNSA